MLCGKWNGEMKITPLPLTEINFQLILVICAVFCVLFPVLGENKPERKSVRVWGGCACGRVCVRVAWRCSVIVDKSRSPPVVRADIVVLFPWQTSHSSHKLDVQKWFYFSIEWQVSILLDAVGDINPVIFTVVNIAWRHVVWVLMIE